MLGYRLPATNALPGTMVESFTSLARTNLLHNQAIFRSPVGNPEAWMWSVVSPNEMIGRGLALAGKLFQAASAAVGGLGGDTARGPARVPRPPTTSIARTKMRAVT